MKMTYKVELKDSILLKTIIKYIEADTREEAIKEATKGGLHLKINSVKTIKDENNTCY